MGNYELKIKEAKRRALILCTAGYFVALLVAFIKDKDMQPVGLMYFFLICYIIQRVQIKRSLKYYNYLTTKHNVEEKDLQGIDDKKIDIATKVVYGSVVVGLVVSSLNYMVILFAVLSLLWLDNSKNAISVYEDDLVNTFTKKYRRINLETQIKIYTNYYFVDTFIHAVLIISIPFILRELHSLSRFAFKREVSTMATNLTYLAIGLVVISIVTAIIFKKKYNDGKAKGLFLLENDDEIIANN